MVADVLKGAVLQHLRRDPWKICALGLSIWVFALLAVSLNGLIGYSEFLIAYLTGQLFLLAAAAWTVRRQNAGIFRAAAASAKAALLPDAALLIVATIRLSRYCCSGPVMDRHSLDYWIVKNVLITVLVSLAFGMAGASLARAVYFLRPHARK